MSSEIRQLIESVKEIESQVDYNFSQIRAQGNDVQNKTVVILLGPTGSGKTTLCYALTGKQLIGIKGNPYPLIDVVETDRNSHFQIGHGPKAQTIIPGLIYDPETDIILCDCPGFFDNRTDVQDATNSFAIHSVLNHAKKIKIILVMSDSSIEGAKGKDLLESCKLVENLFTNQNNVCESIGLIITNVHPDDMGDALLANVHIGDSWLLKNFRERESNSNRTSYIRKCSSGDNVLRKDQINKLVASVNDVEKQIEKSFANILNECHSPEDRTLLLLLGPTGSGKTTLTYALTNQELYCFRDNYGKRRLEAKEKKVNFEIGHTGVAQTFIPGFQYDDKTGIIFCDCPGFFDNRGEIQDISNSFAISDVLNKAKKVKILLLTSCSDLISAKGKAFRESCEIVEKLIPNQEDFQNIIGLVITHVDPDLCDEDMDG